MKTSVKLGLGLMVVLVMYYVAWGFIGWSLSKDTAVVDVWTPPTIQQMADATVIVIIDKGPCANPACPRDHKGHGSGVLVGQGQVLTAWHLYRDTPVASFVLYQGTEYPVTKVLLDPDSDLAMLYVDLPEHAVVEISLEDPPLGADVILIGSPGHKLIGQRVVKGNISNLYPEDLLKALSGAEPGSQERLRRWSRVVATTCYSGHGNSGGPVFYNGKVVGIFVGVPFMNHNTLLAYAYTVYVPVYEFNTE